MNDFAESCRMEAEPSPDLLPRSMPGSSTLGLAGACRKVALGLLLLTAIASLLIGSPDLVLVFFRRQDLAVLAAIALTLLIIGLRPGVLRAVPRWRMSAIRPTWLFLPGFIVMMAGVWMVFGNYDISRDEFMANFDASVFAAGRLAWPVPPQWRGYSDALMPLYMLAIPGKAAWISDYLPGNAMLRAAADHLIGREFLSPLLALLAAASLWRVSRRLWPEQPGAATLPVVLLMLSAQFLITAMTPFAMTALLAFNLLWLLCFLQSSRRGDFAALAVGFVATGVHQIIFHPLFVAPFLVELLLAGRVRRTVFFLAGYAVVCAFWALYPHMVVAQQGLAATSGSGLVDGGLAFVAKVASLVHAIKVQHLFLMLFNLLRFVAWQHPLLLPLVLCSGPAIARAEGIARPLLSGILLMLLVALVIMPMQGYGWGYRYLHGYLGSFCLLAVYGWRRLDPFANERRAGLIVTSALSVAIILPFLMTSTFSIVAPYRTATEAILSTNSDVVLVDGTGVFMAQILVRNDPVHHQRPLVMDLDALNDEQLKSLCSRFDVRLFERRNARAAGIPLTRDLRPSRGRSSLQSLGCAKPLPLSPKAAAAG